MPSTVDKRPFEVGKNLALSPGAVVFRSPVCEVIQYAPATDKVYERPLLFIPPQINKFYIMDLAPGRSFVEYAVKHGMPMFTISWRNPTPQNRDWGLDEYVDRVQGRDRRRLRDQRQSRLQRARRMRRRHHDLADARASRGVGRQARQRGHAAGHDARHEPALDDRDVRDRGRHQGGARSLGGKRRARRRRHGARVRVAASQRSGVELLGQQLPARQRSARRSTSSIGTPTRPIFRPSCTRASSICS